MVKVNKKRLAKEIKRYRREHELTLLEFANKIPTTLNTVYRWEAGKSVPRNQLTVNRLKELGIKIK